MIPSAEIIGELPESHMTWSRLPFRMTSYARAARRSWIQQRYQQTGGRERERDASCHSGLELMPLYG